MTLSSSCELTTHQSQDVFRAWADPKRKARWFAGSVDALGNGYELDFQVGGREVNRGGPPGGPVYTYSAQFRDIVVDRRIVRQFDSGNILLTYRPSPQS